MQTVRTPPEVVADPSRRSDGKEWPSSRSFWDVVRRHPFVIAFFVVLGACMGAAAGYTRKPAFQASVPMVITQVNTNSPSNLNGYAAAAPQLADAYSRLATSGDVLRAVSKQIGVPQSQVAQRLSAGPVPESPVFYLHATAPNAAAAITLVNADSLELVSYVAQTNQPSPGPKKLFAEYRAAAEKLQRAQTARLRAQAAYYANKTPARQAALLKAQAAVQVARVRTSSLQTAYTNTTANNLAPTNLRVIRAANHASSDRPARVEKLMVIGAVAGLLFGIAAAWLIGTPSWRRGRA